MVQDAWVLGVWTLGMFGILELMPFYSYRHTSEAHNLAWDIETLKKRIARHRPMKDILSNVNL